MIVFYDPSHMLELADRTGMQEMASPEYASQFERGEAYSCIQGGKVTACAGVMEKWKGTGVAWAVFDPDAGRAMLEITRACMVFLGKQSYKRIEAYVRSDYDLGHKWARMLGFEREGQMKAFDPAGRDCDMYARVANGY
jgi:hypothetical protein